MPGAALDNAMALEAAAAEFAVRRIHQHLARSSCNSGARRLFTTASVTDGRIIVRSLQTARPGSDADDNRAAYCGRPPHNLLSKACRFHPRSSFNCGSTGDIAELRVRAATGLLSLPRTGCDSFTTYAGVRAQVHCRR